MSNKIQTMKEMSFPMKYGYPVQVTAQAVIQAPVEKVWEYWTYSAGECNGGR